VTARDHWAEWLLKGRFGGQEQTPEWAAKLRRTRDRVLDGAKLKRGAILLDVGAGDGLIAFGALERGAGEVIFSDISDDLLEHARSLAATLGVSARCRFVHAAADDLAPIEDAFVDVVTTRSVLIYVENKAGAFAEFHRVLRPGGRISLFEPINRFCGSGAEATFWGYPLDGLADVRDKLNALYDAHQPPDDPMLDFDERDLIDLALASGFFPVELDLELEIAPHEPTSWERFLNTPGNPTIPSPGEAIETTLDAHQRDRFVRHMRPLVERGDGVARWARAYLRATKPAV
jgi:arsenite methyltransferase